MWSYIREKLYNMKSIFLAVIAFSFPSLLFAQQTTGLFQYDWPTEEGFILWSPLLNGHNTYLMNNCGQIVHTWNTPNTTPGNSHYLLSDGTLMMAAKADTALNNPIGGGGGGERIMHLDWDGNVLWDYIHYDNTKKLHHDIEILPNGNVLAIVWEIVDSVDCVAAGRDPEKLSSSVLWNERIIEVERTGLTTGNVVWEWDVFDHLVQDFDPTKDNYGVVTEHPELLDINWLNTSIPDSARDDFMHFNSVAYNAEFDQIVFSSQGMSEIYIIDHSTNSQEAASHTGGTSGKGGDFLYRYGNPQVYDRGGSSNQVLWRQHDAKWIPEGYLDGGSIMIFNNGLDRPVPMSEIDVITPPQSTPGVYETLALGEAFGPEEKTWNYHAPDSVSFYSYFISGATRSATGSTFICAGESGRMFEVTYSGEKVWEYINPVAFSGILSSTDEIPLAGGGNFHGNLVFRAEKYPSDFSGFDGHDLSTGVQLEANPFLSSCVVGVDDFEDEEAFSIYPNPSEGSVTIEGLRNAEMNIFDASGRNVLLRNITTNNERFDLSGLSSGLYMIQFSHNGKRISSKLMVQ